MRICVAAICRDEEKNMAEWLKHVSAADAISIVDTGSIDATTQIVSEFAHPALYHSTDISEERNLGASRDLAAAPFHEDDLIVWLDIDERFDDPDWVEKLRQMPDIEQADGVWILMRNGDSQYDQMKAYKSRAYTWRYRAHEVLMRIREGNPPHTVRAEFATDHFPDHTKPRGYLMELARDAGDWPRDQRCSFYYARELCYSVAYYDRADLLDDARAEVARLTKLATWSDYVAVANLELSKATFKQGFIQEAVNCCYRAIAARSDRIECYAMLSDIFYRRDDMINSVGMAIQGLSVAQQNPKSFLFDQTSVNLDLCYECAYWGCRNLNMVEPALNYLAQLSLHRGLDVETEIKASGLLGILAKQALNQEKNSNAESCETQNSSNSESEKQRGDDDQQAERGPDVGEQSQSV
ncbi:hypothetical protein pEaSNUABM14_00153 [Erwinia phage pEa_SNUABM_14]|nr:hypothetical protein pEaSNUABM14_00153 [Erwinia phage pEa_SNUABM_14]